MTDIIRPLPMHQTCSATPPLSFLLPAIHHHRRPYAVAPIRPARQLVRSRTTPTRPSPSASDVATLPSSDEPRASRAAMPTVQLNTQHGPTPGVHAADAHVKLPLLPTAQYQRPNAPFTGSVAGSQASNETRDFQKGHGRPASPRSAAPPRTAAERAQTQQGQNADENTIVPSLQIPSSINDSKGSLAEFAAQITCLFWFESYSLLHAVEEAEAAPLSATRLVPEARPNSGFRKWATTILSTTQVTQNVILLALLFIYRLKKQKPTVKGKPGSEFRLLTVALMLGNKFLDDNTYTNKTWAEVSGISVQEMHIMEVEFLSNMRYSLFVSEAEWKDWHVKLGKFWNYFEHASRASLDVARRPSGPPTPTSNISSPLPTPPASNHASPPYLASYSSNPLAYPYAVPVPAASYILPAVARTPELDQQFNPRKRSLDDGSHEPPPKRMVRETRPLAGRGTSDISIPSYSTGIMANGSSLSMQIPSICAPRSTSELFPAVSAPQSLPGGRAMSVSFVPQPAAVRLPVTLAPSVAAHSQLSANNLSPYAEASRRQTIYPVSSVGSPASVYYSAASSQGTMSPSYILSHRNSPYRPVRDVSTLLGPPRSGFIHAAPQHLPFDQMHYQPLAKSRGEYRTGVVPYLHHDAWPNMQQMPPWPTVTQSGMSR